MAIVPRQSDAASSFRQDRETTTVEAAAAFEQRRGEGPTVLVYGRHIDVDDRPSPREL